MINCTMLVSVFCSWPDHKLHLIACDVGQGDAYLVKFGFIQILIDGGKDNAVLNCLDSQLPLWDRQIDLVIATHDDSDHIGGLVEVSKRYRIKNLIWNGKDTRSANWLSIIRSVKKQNTNIIISDKQNYNLSGIDISLLWPYYESRQEEEDNSVSVVSQIRYGDFSVLFTGDIDTLTEENLIRASIPLESTVLKVSHHGSRFSTSDNWLDQVNPEIALIGVGKNTYGHPSGEVLDRLNQKGIDIYRTDKDGVVEIISDGKEWHITNTQSCLFATKNLFNSLSTK